jgi:hypothetical protein
MQASAYGSALRLACYVAAAGRDVPRSGGSVKMHSARLARGMFMPPQRPRFEGLRIVLLTGKFPCVKRRKRRAPVCRLSV